MFLGLGSYLSEALMFFKAQLNRQFKNELKYSRCIKNKFLVPSKAATTKHSLLWPAMTEGLLERQRPLQMQDNTTVCIRTIALFFSKGNSLCRIAAQTLLAYRKQGLRFVKCGQESLKKYI